MELKETIELMNSDNYVDRFIAEYRQLEIRRNGLYKMLKKYKKGEFDLTPTCSYDLLNGQLKSMDLYSEYLMERALIEGIEL